MALIPAENLNELINLSVLFETAGHVKLSGIINRAIVKSFSTDIRVAVTALIKQDQATYDPYTIKYLAVSRKTNDKDLGLPGGKIDHGESLYNGLVREVREETGLSVKSAIPIFVRMDENFLVITHAAYAVGEISTMESGIVDYVSSTELVTNSSFGEYNRQLLEYINRFPKV